MSGNCWRYQLGQRGIGQFSVSSEKLNILFSNKLAKFELAAQGDFIAENYELNNGNVQ